MSNQNQHTAGSRALQTDRETRGEWWPILALWTTTFFDRTFTVLYWGYESNPLVSYAGIGAWLGFTFALLYIGTAVWGKYRLWEVRIAKWCVIILSALTFLAFLTNVYVVYLQ